MASQAAAHAKDMLRAQSELLSRYAASLEHAVRNKDIAPYHREALTRRANLAREMAGVMFRAATYDRLRSTGVCDIP